jgi:nicotinamidase-related amidase
MAATQIDPTTALVLVDLQKGVLRGQFAPHSSAEVVERSARLARAFRQKGLPVVLVNVIGGVAGRTEDPPRQGGSPPPADWTEIVEELDPQPSDIRISKRGQGAFYETGLHDELRKRGVTQVLLAGVATSRGVESTARSAYQRGYNVTLVTDAVSDGDAEAHNGSLRHVIPHIAESDTLDAVLGLLERL